MELTNNILSRFAGGMIVIENWKMRCSHRGRIVKLTIELDVLGTDLKWYAKGTGGFPPTGWAKVETNLYSINVQGFAISDVGEGRIVLTCPVTGKLVTLSPLEVDS